ncbi:MAG: polysaccharide biosynthesis/export family protein [Bacteroidetes bacterium]|nr:polysaccharide biosynthesis/export family protein [Bacteroidota bacterium]
MRIKSALSFIGLLGILLMIASCVPQKKIIYLQSALENDTISVYQNELKADYKVQPGDILYIRVTSMDDKANNYLNQGERQTQQYTDATLYLEGYTVNDSGYIDFPLVGSFFVLNQTTQEIKVSLQEKIDIFFVETSISVKLANFNVTLIGEFNRPGKYNIYQDRINLFQAISMGGDLTDFANRNRVALIRQTEKGSVIHRLDLTEKSIIASDYYYLKPNDIVYAEPLKGKQFTFAQFPYAVIFAAISTALLLINYFNN